jgi:hypothetical protein
MKTVFFASATAMFALFASGEVVMACGLEFDDKGIPKNNLVQIPCDKEPEPILTPDWISNFSSGGGGGFSWDPGSLLPGPPEDEK